MAKPFGYMGVNMSKKKLVKIPSSGGIRTARRKQTIDRTPIRFTEEGIN